MPDHQKYHFFVDAKKYESDEESITGAEIKQMIQDFNPAYQLFLENPGDEPDTLVSDTEAFSLDPKGHGVRRFYTVPPATFG